MKIIKVTRNFITHKKYGHTVGLKFVSFWDTYGHASRVEKLCERLLGSRSGRNYDYGNGRWSGYFGSNMNEYGHRSYYITFRDQKDLTLILLADKDLEG